MWYGKYFKSSPKIEGSHEINLDSKELKENCLNIERDADDTEIREVTDNGIIVWEYDYPGSNNSLIARCDKYGVDYFDQQAATGDLNYDDIINILDVIILVNMALNNTEDDLNGDMNSDGIINILDVVILVGIILG